MNNNQDQDIYSSYRQDNNQTDQINNNQNNLNNNLYSTYNSNHNVSNNNSYNSYNNHNNQNSQLNNEEKPYIVLSDKEVNKKRRHNRYLTIATYGVFLIIAGLALSMYESDKYEFYISKPEVLLANNSNYQIELKPKNESLFDYKNYKYESTNKDVVTVDDSGKVTAVSNGEAEIKIKYKYGFNSKTVKVKTEELGDAEINSTYENGQIETVVSGREEMKINVDYRTNNPKIEVDSYGHVEKEADSKGTVVVYSTNGNTKEVNVPSTPVKIDVKGIEIKENNIVIKKGTNGKINAIVLPENATNKTLTYKVDNGNVSVDNNGNIKGVKTGVSLITITSNNGHIAYCVVTVVEDKKLIEKIDVNPKEIEMKVGDTKDITLEVVPSDATERELIIESKNAKVATVENGKIVGKADGETEVGVRTTDSRIKETIKVVIKTNVIDVTELKLSDNKIP